MNHDHEEQYKGVVIRRVRYCDGELPEGFELVCPGYMWLTSPVGHDCWVMIGAGNISWPDTRYAAVDFQYEALLETMLEIGLPWDSLTPALAANTTKQVSSKLMTITQAVPVLIGPEGVTRMPVGDLVNALEAQGREDLAHRAKQGEWDATREAEDTEVKINEWGERRDEHP